MDWREQVLNIAQQATAGFTPAPTTTVVAEMPLSVGFPSPQFDPLEFMPERAQDRLRKLRDRAADAHAVCVPFADIQEASARKTDAANARRHLTDHPQDWGKNLPPDHPSVVQAQRTLDRATEDFERIKQRSEAKTAAWQAASAALANIETWLKSGRPGGTTLEDFDGPEPKLVKGENSLLDAIENRRRRTRELKADLHRIASAPFPSAYCKAKMRQQVEQLAQRGEPSVSRLVELGDGPVDFQTMHLRSEVVSAEQQRALAFAELPDIALVAWLDPAAMIKRLDALIDAESDDKSALSVEAREKAAAETQSDLLAVERDESWFVWSAIEQNLPCEHRSDCSPLAILQARLVTAPRPDASPPTTPGLSWLLQR
jgi:hypothetical protein